MMVMYRRNKDQNTTDYCVPKSFKELKYLVSDGWCVEVREEVDLKNFYMERYQYISMKELGGGGYRWHEFPEIPFSKAMDEIEEHEVVLFDGDELLPEDFLYEDFGEYLRHSHAGYIDEAEYNYKTR